MPYVYHRVPDQMRGTVIHPLAKLETAFPDLYVRESTRYLDRDWLPTMKVPPLKCDWQDLIQFSAIHPKVIQEALLEVGIGFSGRWFEVPVEMFAAAQTTVFHYRKEFYVEDVMANGFGPEMFVSFFPEDTDVLYTDLARGTRAHYQDFKMQDRQPFPYHLTPHILHRGSLDMGGVKIVKV